MIGQAKAKEFGLKKVGDLEEITCLTLVKRQNFRLVQIERICGQQNKYESKVEIGIWMDTKHCG